MMRKRTSGKIFTLMLIVAVLQCYWQVVEIKNRNSVRE